jgi:hypothetical protein
MTMRAHLLSIAHAGLAMCCLAGAAQALVQASG